METTVNIKNPFVSKFRFLMKSCARDFKGHLHVEEQPADNGVDFICMTDNPDVLIAVGYLVRESEVTPKEQTEFNIRTSFCLN